MEQKRLFLAVVLSATILLAWQLLAPHPAPRPPASMAQQQAETSRTTPSDQAPKPVADPAYPGNLPEPGPVPKDVPRVTVDTPRVKGSISLLGARFDDLVMRDYHETIDPNSPLYPLLIPAGAHQPTYMQVGWWADDAAVKVPDGNTVWTASGGELTPVHPVTMTWDNGTGLVFAIALSIDDNYMLGVRQTVRNAGAAPIGLHPWARVRRDYTPPEAASSILHEGPIGVVGGVLQEMGYDAVKKQAEKDRKTDPADRGAGYVGSDRGGWAGITDKYMLAAIVPDQSAKVTTRFRHLLENGSDRYQVDFQNDDTQTVTPGGEVSYASHLFAGAKEVRLLDRYQREDGIPLFSYAVDFGRFWFLTRPILYALDWLNSHLGNFGLAILAFTVFVKLLFFPLANKSYRSMSKMKLLNPKMTELRERYKDDPAKLQAEMMSLYKTEGVNPASGCLPILVQIPVFFSLYKDIYINIEMWHAPFFGWIRDLSVPDPTNVFNLFGLIPVDPTTLPIPFVAPFLHLGIWPLVMGLTMVLQQRMNPPPPDPTQARLMQLMPILFTFMLGRFAAGLVIYWTWNNTLTIVQQWFIQRGTRLSRARVART